MTIAVYGYEEIPSISVYGYAFAQIVPSLSSGIPFTDTLPRPKVVKEQEKIQDISFLVVVNRLKFDSQFSLLINRIKEKAILNIAINVLHLSKVYNIIVNRVITKIELFSLGIKIIETKNILIEKVNEIKWDIRVGNQ